MKGFVVGKFAPLHNGHCWFIEKALEQCDELFIIVSDDPRFNNSLPENLRRAFDIASRVDSARMLARELGRKTKKRLFVGQVDERDIPGYPNGWPEFIKLCLDCMAVEGFVPDAVFSSEPSYEEGYATYLPQCRHVLVEPDRSTVPISATDIRNMAIESRVLKDRAEKLGKQAINAVPWHSALMVQQALL